VLEGRGYYRCVRCRSEAVSKRRRTVKRKLVEEAGGRVRDLRLLALSAGPAVPPPRPRRQGVSSRAPGSIAIAGAVAGGGAQVRPALRQLSCRGGGGHRGIDRYRWV